MINPLDVATGGYLGGNTLCIATSGYICPISDVIVPVDKKPGLKLGSGTPWILIDDKVEYHQKLNRQIIREDEEILIIIKAFLATL